MPKVNTPGDPNGYKDRDFRFEEKWSRKIMNIPETHAGSGLRWVKISFKNGSHQNAYVLDRRDSSKSHVAFIITQHVLFRDNDIADVTAAVV
jgi:hypothetical protein